MIWYVATTRRAFLAGAAAGLSAAATTPELVWRRLAALEQIRAKWLKA
jgi:ABC-type Mn2+/Zn2+ transport system permease subunit